MRPIKPVAVLLILFCISCVSDNTYVFKRDRIKQIVKQQSLQPINEYLVYRSPSYPKEVKRIATLSDPVEALVVALPYVDAMSNNKIFTFYMSIISHAITVTDVIILVNERELFDFKAILNQLTSYKLDRYLYSGQNHQIRIVPARFSTKWIRDYGPIFVYDNQGRISITDAIYRDVREEITHSEDFSINELFKKDLLSIVGARRPDSEEEEEKYDHNNRYEDDTVSMYLTNHLYHRHGYDIPITRVPFQLQGGDIFGDGSNNLFISSETLLINGGFRMDLELILKSYYGMKTITYLEPFPGDTVKHLDMIFKPVGSDRFLVADYPARVVDDDVYMQYLHRETKRILDYNANKLRQNFPERSIVKIPMPPIQRISELSDALLALTKALFTARNYDLPQGLVLTPERWDTSNFVFLCYVLTQFKNLKSQHAVHLLPKVLGLYENIHFPRDYEAVLNRTVSLLLESNSQLLAWIAESYRSGLTDDGYNTLSHEALLKKLLADYIQEGMEEDPGNYLYVYRSYLNAIYINGKSGRLLLVPSYSGCQKMEQEVYAIYTEQFPDTNIVFINSDEIIKQYGAIHCVTMTVPDFKRK